MMESGQMLSFIPVPDIVIDSVISGLPASYAGLTKGISLVELMDPKFTRWMILTVISLLMLIIWNLKS